MRPIRKTRHALMIFGAGAAAAYFFDPDSGPQRRARMVDKFRAMGASMPTSGGGTSDEPSSDSGSESMSMPSGDGSESSGPIDLATGRPLAETATGT